MKFNINVYGVRVICNKHEALILKLKPTLLYHSIILRAAPEHYFSIFLGNQFTAVAITYNYGEIFKDLSPLSRIKLSILRKVKIKRLKICAYEI